MADEHAVRSTESRPQATAAYVIDRPGTQEELFGMREIAAIIRNSASSVMVITGILALAGFAVSIIMTPKYSSDVLVSEVRSGQGGSGFGALPGQLSGIASLAGLELASADSDLATTLATLESRNFTLQFIRQHELTRTLFADVWNVAAEDWMSPEVKPTENDAYKAFDAIREVTQDRTTGLVTVSITWTDRHRAADWANALVADVNRHLRLQAIDEAQRSKGFLERELKTTSIVELRQAIFGLIESQVNKIMLANVRDEFALKVIDSAVVADEGDYSTPSRILIVFCGILVGLATGILFALYRHSARPAD